MKSLFATITATGLVYMLMSLIAGNWYPFQWHWGLRIVTVLWLIATWREILHNNSDNINKK